MNEILEELVREFDGIIIDREKVEKILNRSFKDLSEKDRQEAVKLALGKYDIQHFGYLYLLLYLLEGMHSEDWTTTLEFFPGELPVLSRIVIATSTAGFGEEQNWIRPILELLLVVYGGISLEDLIALLAFTGLNLQGLDHEILKMALGDLITIDDEGLIDLAHPAIKDALVLGQTSDERLGRTKEYISWLDSLGDNKRLRSYLNHLGKDIVVFETPDQAIDFFIDFLKDAQEKLEQEETQENLYKLSLFQNKIGDIFVTNDEPFNAILYFKQALESKDKLLSEYNQFDLLGEMGSLYLVIGEIYRSLGQTSDAHGYIHEALAFLKAAYEMNPDDPEIVSDLLDCYYPLGVLYFMAGMPDKTVNFLEELLKLAEKMQEMGLNPDLELQMHTLNLLGKAYFLEEKYKKALEVHEKALKLAKEFFDLDKNPMSAWILVTTLENVGMSSANADDYEKAFDVSKRALDIYEKYCMDPVDLDTLEEVVDYNEEFARLYTVLGRVDQAKLIMQNIIDILEKALKDSSDTGIALTLARLKNKAGDLYLALGETERAFVLYSQAKDLIESIKDITNVDRDALEHLAYSVHNIALIYANEEIYDKALDYLLKELDLQEILSELFEDKQNLIACYTTIAFTLFRKGDYDGALGYYFEVLDLIEESEDIEKDSEKTLGKISAIYHGIAGAYKYKGDFEEAKDYHQQNIGICLTLFNDYQNVNSLGRMLKSYEALKSIALSENDLDSVPFYDEQIKALKKQIEYLESE